MYLRKSKGRLWGQLRALQGGARRSQRRFKGVPEGLHGRIRGSQGHFRGFQWAPGGLRGALGGLRGVLGCSSEIRGGNWRSKERFRWSQGVSGPQRVSGDCKRYRERSRCPTISLGGLNRVEMPHKPLGTPFKGS